METPVGNNKPPIRTLANADILTGPTYLDAIINSDKFFEDIKLDAYYT
jgi:hypothetical protein